VVPAAGTRVLTVQMAPVCAIDDVDVLVAGETAEPGALDALRARGVEVVLA
jgi:DeoR family transcriptional regulator, aga operon transcriptional repressor